jgi:hypothetical protein
VRLIAGGAIDRRPACVRSYVMHSIAGASLCNVCSIVGVAFDRNAFDHTYCNRSHITAHGTSVEAMEHKVGKGLRLTWSALDRGLCTRSQLRTIANLV